MPSVIRGDDNFDSGADLGPATRTVQTPSRSGGVTYQNTTGADIFWTCNQDGRRMYVSAGPSNGSFIQVTILSYYSTGSVVVPDGHYYYRDGSGGSTVWTETRA